jgi:hypothetical protein
MVNWTEKRVERLQALSKLGICATSIARRLGPSFSKGIVLRKLRQLEAERQERAAVRAARKLAKAKAIKAEAAAEAVTMRPRLATKVVTIDQGKAQKQVAPRALPASGQADRPRGVRLFDLRGGDCRWPVDDGRPARLFCGSPVVRTTSWCEHHQRIAFTGFGRPKVGQEHRG